MILEDVRRSATALGRRALLAGVQRLTGRTAVLLPVEAGSAELLDARAPYRLVSDHVDYEINAARGGDLKMRILEHVVSGPAPVVWRFASIAMGREVRLTLDRRSGTLLRDGAVIGRMTGPVPAHRFTTEFVLRGADGGIVRRRLGHYVAQTADDETYFTGGHYRDYDAQAAGDVDRTMARLRAWDAAPAVLEVGCATGLLLAACAHAGLDAMGIDVSPWAVERARTRVAAGSVVLSDVDGGDLPAQVTHRRFRTVVMNAVLEHVEAPDALLGRLAGVAERGALLFLTTANANSLTRWLFGPDWEGLADPTHKSAHLITPDRLSCWLDATGWRVEQLTTHSVWDDNPDPVHATLRDVAASDARFRQLLVQYQRGDFLECVARRRSS